MIESAPERLMVHKDTARMDIVDSLQGDSVLITQDFAMKFLPAQYMETQTEFLAREVSPST